VKNNMESQSARNNIFLQNDQFLQKNPNFQNNPEVPSTNPLENEEENKHLKMILSAFFNYKVDSLRDVARMERDFNTIKEEHKKLLKFDYQKRLETLKTAINKNFFFLYKVVETYSYMFKFFKTKDGTVFMEPLNVSHKETIKLRSTLKLFIRDWAAEGAVERDKCYKPIIEEFKKYFPNTKKENGTLISVLLPGAGLGRLVYEFAKLGYKSQGNEFSYFMLLSSNYILNCVTKTEEFEIHPLIHSFSNLFWENSPLKGYKIPDECPADSLSNESDMSMVAGEFVEAYKDCKDPWDSVVTSFFIDTANNIIEYIETIHKILNVGGVWINFGPLLYHYSDLDNECSIELSWEELKHIIANYGFEFKNEEIKETVYNSDINSMMYTVYRCIFFTAVKIK